MNKKKEYFQILFMNPYYTNTKKNPERHTEKEAIYKVIFLIDTAVLKIKEKQKLANKIQECFENII